MLLQLVPERDFTPEQLAQHDGSNPSLPMLISIRGVVFDVSSGKQFYGPNGEAAACLLIGILGGVDSFGSIASVTCKLKSAGTREVAPKAAAAHIHEATA
jgi:hypothetical protein